MLKRLDAFVLVAMLAMTAAFAAAQRNGASCNDCHAMPTQFGSSPVTVTRLGHLDHGKFVPSAEGGIRHTQGVDAKAPATDKMTGDRVTLSLLGDGFIEALDDLDLAKNAKTQRERKDGIGGQGTQAPVLEAGSAQKPLRAGRYGWKAQHATLESAVADSLRNELGVRNALYPDEYANHNAKDGPTPYDMHDPATGLSELERLVAEVHPYGNLRLCNIPL